MPTLDVNPETVCHLIQLAREFHAQEAVVFPDDPISPTEDWPTQILAAHASDPTLSEFRSIIADLYPDQQVQVVALLWLGRDDYTESDWEMLVQDAEDAWNPRTAEYLIAHPLLAEHLTDGLELFGYHCE